MDQGLAGLAFAAGMIAAAQPVRLRHVARLPGAGGQREQTSRPRAVGRALTATAAMAVGFLTVFGLFGLLTVSAASTVQQYAPYLTLVVGVVLVALGLWLLSGRG